MSRNRIARVRDLGLASRDKNSTFDLIPERSGLEAYEMVVICDISVAGLSSAAIECSMHGS